MLAPLRLRLQKKMQTKAHAVEQARLLAQQRVLEPIEQDEYEAVTSDKHRSSDTPDGGWNVRFVIKSSAVAGKYQRHH